MGLRKMVFYAAIGGTLAFGGYEVGKKSAIGQTDNQYSILSNNNQKFLYSKVLEKTSPISIIEGRVVLGNSSDNLEAYNMLKTKEIASQVIGIYEGKKPSPKISEKPSIIYSNNPTVTIPIKEPNPRKENESLVDRIKDFGSDVRKSLKENL